MEVVNENILLTPLTLALAVVSAASRMSGIIGTPFKCRKGNTSACNEGCAGAALRLTFCHPTSIILTGHRSSPGYAADQAECQHV